MDDAFVEAQVPADLHSAVRPAGDIDPAEGMDADRSGRRWLASPDYRPGFTS